MSSTNKEKNKKIFERRTQYETRRKSYTVFNADLVEGIPANEETRPGVKENIERVDNFLDGWSEKEAKIVYGGDVAYYSSRLDEIHPPEQNAFRSTAEFYSTALVAPRMGCVDQDPGVLQNRIDFNGRTAKLGRALVSFAAESFYAAERTVNEQNVQAVGFYKKMGFVLYRRTQTDEQGGPYPLLYMKRGRAGEAL